MAAHPNEWTAPVIATCLAFICGFIVLGIGLLRLGWLVEFIPQPAVSGFMTGSAINIAAGQVPALLGLAKLFDTKAATYQVIINTLKFLPQSSLDAAFGVSALALLYIIKWSLAWASGRYPRFARPAFFLQALRHAFVIILFTIISWRINIHSKTARVALVGTVPSGLQNVGSPYISASLLAALGPHIPVATIILLLEHISISKSFGRLNGYEINPNQELIAIGVNNTLGSVFNAYPSTGSFSRSALKSKSGVRTPAAGIATGVLVLIALYAVAPAFYYIPNAALSALIIHAVADLVASPRQSFGFCASPRSSGSSLLAPSSGLYSTRSSRVSTGLSRPRLSSFSSVSPDLEATSSVACASGPRTSNPVVRSGRLRAHLRWTRVSTTRSASSRLPRESSSTASRNPSLPQRLVHQ